MFFSSFKWYHCSSYRSLTVMYCKGMRDGVWIICFLTKRTGTPDWHMCKTVFICQQYFAFCFLVRVMVWFHRAIWPYTRTTYYLLKHTGQHDRFHTVCRGYIRSSLVAAGKCQIFRRVVRLFLNISFRRDYHQLFYILISHISKENIFSSFLPTYTVV